MLFEARNNLRPTITQVIALLAVFANNCYLRCSKEKKQFREHFKFKHVDVLCIVDLTY